MSVFGAHTVIDTPSSSKTHERPISRHKACVDLFTNCRRSRGLITSCANSSKELQKLEREAGRSEVAAMAGAGIFDLEKQFAFYGAYHSNRINILIHLVFVWPILFTALLLLAYSKPLAPQLPVMAALPFHEYMVLNYSFVFSAVYALYYISLEPKSGSLGALLVLLCWVGANAVAQHVPWVSGWKVCYITSFLFTVLGLGFLFMNINLFLRWRFADCCDFAGCELVSSI